MWDAFETNCTHGKYQFAVLAYHMLTMSFVYFNIWQIWQSRPEDFEKGLIACDNAKIVTYAKLVDDRNDTVHPSGNIFFSTEVALDSKAREILPVANEIQSCSKPVIECCCREVLLQNHDPEEREYPDAADQIREVLTGGVLIVIIVGTLSGLYPARRAMKMNPGNDTIWITFLVRRFGELTFPRDGLTMRVRWGTEKYQQTCPRECGDRGD